MQYKKNTLFVARAIGYQSESSRCHYPSWVSLSEGSSEKGVVAALEDLWNKLQQTMPEEAKGMSDPPLYLAYIKTLTLQTRQRDKSSNLMDDSEDLQLKKDPVGSMKESSSRTQA